MNIHITIVAHSLDMRPVVRSLMGDGVTVHCFLHSENEMVRSSCQELAEQHPQFDGHYVGNWGLAKSWNIGLRTSQRMGADVMMIANDDIEASYEDVLKIAETAYSCQHNSARLPYYMVSGMGDDLTTGEHKDMLFALCAITPLAIERIGYFDEQFTPIYFEDLDYYRRADLLGLCRNTRLDTHIKHVGSGTRKARPDEEAQFWVDFERNKAAYINKWGGDGRRGTEQYANPYNDPAKGLRLE